MGDSRMNKGDRVQFQEFLVQRTYSKYPDKRQTLERHSFKEPQEGWFLGWSERIEGRTEWDSDEVGYLFVSERQHKVAMVALADGTRVFRELFAVPADALERLCVD